MSPMKLFEYMAAALGLNAIKKSMLQSVTLQATSQSKACSCCDFDPSTYAAR